MGHQCPRQDRVNSGLPWWIKGDNRSRKLPRWPPVLSEYNKKRRKGQNQQLLQGRDSFSAGSARGDDDCDCRRAQRRRTGPVIIHRQGSTKRQVPEQHVKYKVI